MLAAGVAARAPIARVPENTLKFAVGVLLSSLGGFTVHRGTADRESLRICEDALRGGEPVVLFPEGTRQSGPTPRFPQGVGWKAALPRRRRTWAACRLICC